MDCHIRETPPFRAGRSHRCKQRNNGARIKAGYPRFQPRSRWRSITIPDASPSMVRPPDSVCGRWKLAVKGLGGIRFDPRNLMVARQSRRYV